MTVEELHRAWAELDELEKQERYLVERLSEIRKAIKAQRLKIDDLGPPTINRLPTELLSQIFALCIPDPKFPEKPLHRIVGVSRRWRDVVWNNPCFWTSIKVRPFQGKNVLEKQLKRSRKALLDIWIEDWDHYELYEECFGFHALLNAIVLHVNRWRSLTISDGMAPEFVESIFTKLNHLRIPFLSSFSFDACDDFDGPYPHYPNFLSPTRTPTLQHLTLRPSLQLDTFMALPTLKTLYLAFAQTDDLPSVTSKLTPAQSLTSLVLDGDNTGWSLKRNDLHFPLLEELTLYLDSPMSFLEAIVAPKLRYVRCWIRDPVEFNTIEGKFRDVYDLSLTFCYSANDQDAESLCRAFPGVRRVCLSAGDTSFLAAGVHGSGVLERRPPIDQWLNLETVTFNGFYRRWLEHRELDDPIVKWLRGRQESGLSRLRVRLHQIKADEGLPVYYALLGRHCDLEIFT